MSMSEDQKNALILLALEELASNTKEFYYHGMQMVYREEDMKHLGKEDHEFIHYIKKALPEFVNERSFDHVHRHRLESHISKFAWDFAKEHGMHSVFEDDFGALEDKEYDAKIKKKESGRSR